MKLPLKSSSSSKKLVNKRKQSQSSKDPTTGIHVVQKVSRKKGEALEMEIATRAKKFYGGQEALKPLQIQAVASLAQGQNTFLLASTGFKKSRISEMYFNLLPSSAKPVILVFNPLDALGNNQVEEKIRSNFTAINLTKLTFNRQVAEDIKCGVYNFVYLSPEIFMNNKMWDEIYFSSEFQQRLGLVVVDKAHMIYIWGLVESSHGKKSFSIIVRLQDFSIFRPCYGKIGLHLQCQNKAPILLLSATCRPIAVDSILRSMKLTTKLINVI
ncbi:hypothetical protein PTTG_04431 [Puccinia triticina 1-1 BBBD Race 1]|uniref:DNA 3'-5' helicase n=1 Tax=Puccinia triticina (isolate 1-1 / race 1 (BBBD)) TaxID=630390 RepID=A0A180G5M0_PUCT1|nr:hypothetical protein PTTG_04431 [Puccinia triticina 1-1 BBBD Race 1]